MIRKYLLLLLVIVLFINVKAQHIHTQIEGTNAVVYLPPDYNPANLYPLIYFRHGNGESGTDINKLYIWGPFAKQNGVFRWNQDWTLTIDGVSRKCIVIAHQVTYSYNNANIESLKPNFLDASLDEITSTYSVDLGKIIITGYSAGGWACMGYVSFAQANANRIHGIGIVAAQKPGPIPSVSGYVQRLAHINNAGIRWFGTAGDADQFQYDVYMQGVYDSLVTLRGASAATNTKFRIIPGADHGGQYVHDFFNPTFSNPALSGMNMYEWLLQNTTGNQSPIARAGNDQTITLPTNSVTLNATTSSDPDGTIASYLWTKVSGPGGGNLVNPNNGSTTAGGMLAGTYVYRVTVTDNLGATNSDEVTITVNPEVGNQSPIANAGDDRTVTLPTNTTSLDATGSSDPDGSITAYLWEKISGPSGGTISTPNNGTTNITALIQGTYVYRVTVTDDGNATAQATVTVNVLGAPGSNKVINVAFVSSAGFYHNPEWNNFAVTGNILNGVTSQAFNYSDGSPSSVSFNMNRQISTNDNGVSYTGFTGIPDSVIRYVSAHSSSRNIIVSGVDNAKHYNISLISTRLTTGFSTSVTIGGTTVSNIPTSGNKNSVATFTNISPINGQITIVVNNGSGSTYNHVNAISITEINSAGGNQLPVSNAGDDQVITLPTSSVNLNGALSTDPDGTITTYEWTLLNSDTYGVPNTPTIVTPTTVSTSVTGLIRGTYVFRLKVIDDLLGESVNEVQVRVNSSTNELPVINAGTDTTTSITSYTLKGTAFDWNGTISTTVWSYLSGPLGSVITNPNLLNSTVTGLTIGSYRFVLTVTDNDGGESKDTISVTVVEAPVIPCKADAGINIIAPISGTSTSLNVNNMITLDGSPSFGGTNAQFNWKLLTSVSAVSIAYLKKSNEKVATTQLLRYVDGGYNFELTVTDDEGCISKDTVNVFLPWGATPPQSPSGNGWRRLVAADTVTMNTKYGIGYAKINDLMVEANSGTIQGGSRIDINLLGVASLTVTPGTKIFIRAGNYRSIRMAFNTNTVVGTHENPVIITNYDGQVKAEIFTIVNIKNVKITGEYVPGVSGHPDFKGHANGAYAWSRGKYGLLFDNHWYSTGSAGIRMAGTTVDSVEISYTEICNGNFAGMMLKNDNTGETWRYFRIHDNYLHDIHGEGIYIGSTSGTDPQNLMENWKIYNNRFINAGNEIFQMNQVGTGTDVYNNVFINSASNAKSTFSFSSQQNTIQIQARAGNVKFRNNIALGNGYGMYNVFYGRKSGATVGNDTLYFDNNLHLYNKAFIGGYIANGGGAVSSMVVKITGNYYGKFHFKGYQIFTIESGMSVNTNTVIRTAGGGTPKFYLRDNVIDGSDGKNDLITGSGIDEGGTLTVGSIDNPQFVQSGWPADFNWDNIEQWCDSIYHRWGEEQRNTTGVYVGQPVYYNIGDYVICFSKIYRSKINSNTNHMPTGVTDDYWELQTWSGHDYPPEDYRLVNGSTYQVKGMGLLDVGIPAGYRKSLRRFRLTPSF